MSNSRNAPKYNVAIVEAVMLEVAAELHPRRLTADDLVLRIVSDSDDVREMETAAQAMQGLKEFGLFADQDGTVQPTPAALRAYALLA